jgi:universal stress protein F
MNRILVAVDSSERARAVLDAAIDLARKGGAKLRLLRVVGLPPEMPPSVFAVPPAQLVDTHLEAAKRDLQELERVVPPDLLDGATVQVGVAWDGICSYAKEHDMDMIVIGSHGYGLLDRLVGTTAAKVVNHADRSVLVVRPREAA